MQTKLWSGALAVAALSCGCASPYLFPEYGDSIIIVDGDWAEGGAVREGIVQGDAGNFRDIDTVAPFSVWSYGEGDAQEIGYSADVPVEGGSVFVDVVIGGPDRLVVNEPLHFPPGVTHIGGIWLDVYVCPNGNGESGSADDVVVTRLEDGTISVVATAEEVAQNLDLDVEVAPGMPERPTARFNEMK